MIFGKCSYPLPAKPKEPCCNSCANGGKCEGEHEHTDNSGNSNKTPININLNIQNGHYHDVANDKKVDANTFTSEFQRRGQERFVGENLQNNNQKDRENKVYIIVEKNRQIELPEVVTNPENGKTVTVTNKRVDKTYPEFP